MALFAFTEVWDHSRADGSKLLVLLALADQAHEDGFCWPSIETVGRRARLQKRQVLRVLDDLVALGELEVWKYKFQGKGPERNGYQLVLGAFGLHKGVMPEVIADSLDRVPTGARRSIPGRVRARVFARDGHRCLKCGAVSPLTIDHIKAVVNGGGDEESNLQTLCLECNVRKGTKTLDLRKVGVSEDTYIGDTGDTQVVTPETPAARARSSLNQKGTTSSSQERAARTRKRWPRDDLWDALVEATGIDPQTRNEKKRFGQSVTLLLEAGATPLEVAVRWKRWAKKHKADVVEASTERVLVEHWGELGGRKQAAANVDVCSQCGEHPNPGQTMVEHLYDKHDLGQLCSDCGSVVAEGAVHACRLTKT